MSTPTTAYFELRARLQDQREWNRLAARYRRPSVRRFGVVVGMLVSFLF